MTDMAMTDAQTVSDAPESPLLRFPGSTRNLVPGMAFIVAGIIAPVMGLTTVFFAAAMAWVFVIWGVLFVYMGLLDIYETYEIYADRLVIRNPFRVWDANKVWNWEHISRLDVNVVVKDARLEDARLQVYHLVPGAGDIEREDRDYDPVLAQEIIERAKLQPGENALDDLSVLPAGRKDVYTWTR